MEKKDIKVRHFKCLCGKTRMLSVIDPDGKPFDKEIQKEHSLLVKAGCDVETITLEDANKKKDWCFECKL